jgi:replicative DNA helicase
MYDRMLASETQIDGTTVSLGVPTEAQHELILRSMESLATKGISFVKASSYTVEYIRARALRTKMLKGLDILFVDYLGLIRTTLKTNSREQAVADMITRLKEARAGAGHPGCVSRAAESQGR